MENNLIFHELSLTCPPEDLREDVKEMLQAEINLRKGQKVTNWSTAWLIATAHVLSPVLSITHDQEVHNKAQEIMEQWKRANKEHPQDEIPLQLNHAEHIDLINKLIVPIGALYEWHEGELVE